MRNQVVICLAGPTASGKTDIAIRLREKFPLDIISVDSALVYRGMDIGTAKPDAETLKRAPHRLIDIRDPEENYSAGEFVRDAKIEVNDIRRTGRIPLLVGGTMMYFNSLTEGIAQLPEADLDTRDRLDDQAAAVGWPAMHKRLAGIDAAAAARINPNDGQRIQRALEVFEVSGRTLSDWQTADKPRTPGQPCLKLALVPASRAVLHERIEARLNSMFARGFVEEVRALRNRPGLCSKHSSMRSVGYRQIWSHLDGDYDRMTAEEKALAATRQLAKRQLTWLRSDDSLNRFDPLEDKVIDAISAFLGKHLD
jgi:tRNA dimethylallyltransferase